MHPFVAALDTEGVEFYRLECALLDIEVEFVVMAALHKPVEVVAVLLGWEQEMVSCMCTNARPIKASNTAHWKKAGELMRLIATIPIQSRPGRLPHNSL